MEENQIQKLVLQAKNGNSEAFGQIYDLFAQQIFSFLLARLRHKQTAEDITHTTFLKAWSNLKSYQVRRNVKFSTWLFQIANYTLIDHWRTRKEAVELTKVDNLAEFALEPKLYEEYGFLYQAIEKLPQEYQIVLDLRFNKEFTVSETANIMAKSQVGIRVLQHRALKALKKLLNNLPQ